MSQLQIAILSKLKEDGRFFFGGGGIIFYHQMRQITRYGRHFPSPHPRGKKLKNTNTISKNNKKSKPMQVVENNSSAWLFSRQ